MPEPNGGPNVPPERHPNSVPPLSEPATPVPVQPTSATGSELEYRYLTSFFKWLVGAALAAITLYAGIVTYYLGKSVSDVKNDAKDAIVQTQKVTSEQLRKIGTEAAETARTEAQKRIDEAFQRPGIDTMIEKTARAKVDAAVSQQIQKNLASRINSFEAEVTALQPRTLTADQRTLLSKQWKQFSGSKAYLFSSAFNAEGMRLCEQIASVLQSVGVEVRNGCLSSAIILGGEAVYGIQVTAASADSEFSQKVVKALNEAKLKADMMPPVSNLGDRLQIFIGLNPSWQNTRN